MKRHPKYVISVSLVILLCTGLASYYTLDAGYPIDIEQSPPEKPARMVKTYQIQAPQSIITRTFPGTVQAKRESKIAFRVDGPLIEFDVKIGQFFKEGEIIAKIDSRDFEIDVTRISASLGSSEAKLKAMRRGARREDIEALKARRDSIQASLTHAESQYKRFRALLGQKMVSQADYDQVKSNYDVLTASMEQIKKELEKAQNGARAEDIESMQKQIDQLKANLADANNALKDTHLCAPFDGYIAEKFVENYETIEKGQSIVAIMDCSMLEVSIGLPEDLVAQSQNFIKFECGFESFPGVMIESSLKEIGRKPNQLTQTYPLTVQYPPDDSRPIHPGMTATVHISIKKKSTNHGLVIPVESVVGDEHGSRFVWVYDSDSQMVHKKSVDTGHVLNDSIEIKHGISTGDHIVIAGAHFLKKDQRVTLIQ